MSSLYSRGGTAALEALFSAAEVAAGDRGDEAVLRFAVVAFLAGEDFPALPAAWLEDGALGLAADADVWLLSA